MGEIKRDVQRLLDVCACVCVRERISNLMSEGELNGKWLNTLARHQSCVH